MPVLRTNIILSVGFIQLEVFAEDRGSVVDPMFASAPWSAETSEVNRMPSSSPTNPYFMRCTFLMSESSKLRRISLNFKNNGLK